MEILPRVLIINILLTLGMRFMGRRSRQVFCGERNGRTLFAPTHICTNHKKIVKKSETVKCKKSGVSDFCKTKKFDEWDVEGAVPYKKRPHLGDVLVLFFCSEWCKWYACFVEDSYLAIVKPVISCIERFFNVL